MEKETNKIRIKKIHIRNPYVKQGLTIFLAGLALICAFYGVNNIAIIGKGIHRINDILMPFYLGIVMAFLLCPVYNGMMRVLYKSFKGKCKKPKNDLRLARVFSSIVAVIVIIAVLFGVVMLIVPGTIDSVMMLIPKIQPAFDNAMEWVGVKFADSPEIAATMEGKLDDLSGDILQFAQDKFLNSSSLISGVALGVKATLGTLIDVLVALVICVYILNGKEMFAARAKKLVLSIFNKERSEKIFEFGRLTDNVFSGFINGKIIDSIIIGILCSILMAILHMPLIALVSVIVGITNIIPFFGPFIGAIPSGLLLLIVDPKSAIEFAVMILALQQFDGNILGPKILGKTTKLSAFWVMFAIIVGGGFFGFIGMILGVPVFALIYTYISRAVNRGLENKEKELNTLSYADYSKYGVEKDEVFPKDNSENEE